MPRHALVTALDRRLGPKFRVWWAAAIDPPANRMPTVRKLGATEDHRP